jgi:hypothetical protein
MTKAVSDERLERALMELYQERDTLVAALELASPDDIARVEVLLRNVEAEIQDAKNGIPPEEQR